MARSASSGCGYAPRERLGGKYPLRTTDLWLWAEDVALGYKRLAEVQRAPFAPSTGSTCARATSAPIGAIRVHVLLCGLALLLVRLALPLLSSSPPEQRNLLNKLYLRRLSPRRAPAPHRQTPSALRHRCRTSAGPNLPLVQNSRTDTSPRLWAAR